MLVCVCDVCVCASVRATVRVCVCVSVCVFVCTVNLKRYKNYFYLPDVDRVPPCSLSLQRCCDSTTVTAVLNVN